MAAYNAGGSLTWAAVLNASQFNSGIQSMVAQMAYAQRASSGLQASLAGIAAVSFAAVVSGIAGITAAIYVSTKAASDWQKSMLDVAQLANINVRTTVGREQYNALDRQVQDIFADVAVTKEELFAAMKPYAAADYKGETLSALSEITSKYSLTSGVKSDDIANLIIKAIAMNPGAVTDAGNEVNFANKLLSSISQSANAGVVTQEELITGLTAAGGSMKSWNLQNDIPRQLALLQTMGQYGLDVGSWKTTLASAAGTPGLGGPAKISEDLDKALKAAGVNIPTELTYATGTYESGKKKGQTKYKTEDIPYTGADIGAKLLGMDTESYKQWWDKDSVTAFTTVADKIASLNMTSIDKASLLSLVTGTRAAREFPKMAGVGAADYYNTQLTQLREEYAKGTLAEDLYQTKAQALDAQWQILGNRAHLVKVLLGDMFIGPVTEGVKRFSEHLSGTVEWLQKIFDSSLNPDKTLNSWKAISQVISGIKQKFVELGGVDFLKAGGVAAGLLIVATNLGTIKTAAAAAIKSLITLTGITFGPTATALLGLLGPLSAIALGAAGVAVGLAAIGYSLAPEKFTYFNQLATEAINGVSVVVKQLYTDLSTGDWSAAATHLKDAFMATITWLQGIDWGKLGSEIVTMIGDGANAIIGTALNLAGWIYDSLRGWVDGGGPYKLGQDIADFIGKGLKSASKIDMWETLKSAFGTISNWLELGYDIIANIGSGVMSKVGEAFNPAANKIVEVLAKAAYDIWTVFGKTWNTLIYAATVAATGIGNAFSGVGEKIAGFLQPAIDAVSNLASAISNIKLPSLGDVGSAAGNIINPITEYYNPDSGARISIEEYNKRASGESGSRSTKGFEAVRMYGGSSEIISGNIGNIGASLNTPATLTNTIEGPAGIEIKTKPPEDITGSADVEGGLQVLARTIGEHLAGYRTGGKGFVMDELVAANDKETYLMTDRGDFMTWIKDAKLSTDALKDTLQYYIDFPADSSAMAKEYANMMVPLKETSANIKTSSEEASRITTSGTTTSVNILKDGIKDASDYSTKQTMSITDFVNSTSRSTAVKTGSITKRAVEESYGPVRIGLTDSGQKIAVIGKVAQQQFEQSGNKWVNDTTGAGSTFKGDATSGGLNVKNDLSTGGDILLSKLASAQSGGFGGSSNGSKGKSSDYNDAILDKLGSAVASVLGGSIKGLFGNGSTTTSEAGLLRNVEDITCTGDRVMINTGVYTSPTGEKSAFNPMDNEGARLISKNVEGEFTDMTCMGQTVTINGLKYTNPYGVTSYINPMDYNSGGGVLDYQQQGNILTGAAKDAGKISVDSAKTSSEYQKGSTNYQAQAIEGTTQRWVTTNEYMMAKEENAAIQNGEMWRNNVDFFTSSMDATYFRFDKMTDENIKQAYDYMGSEATVNDKKYQQNMETIKLYEAQISGMTGVNSQLAGLVSSIDSAGANLNASFGSMIASLAASMGVRGGSFGGTSIGGGGSWIGTGSTMVGGNGYVNWGGTAASIIAQSQSTMPRFGSVSWGAKGSLIEEPTRLIAGEKGRELLLPNNLTELFMKLAALGFNNVNGNGGSGDTVIIVNIDGEQVEKVVSRRQKRNLNLKGLKLH